eukprot:scaffold70169_cov45-Cyclotella_meneghiniana.AAC.2
MAMEGVLMDKSSRLLEGSRIPGCLNSDLRSNEGRDSLKSATEPSSLLPVTLPPPDPAPPHRPSKIPSISPRHALQRTLGTVLVAPANALPSDGHLSELYPSSMLAQQLLLFIGSLFILHEWRQQFQKLSVCFSGMTVEEGVLDFSLAVLAVYFGTASHSVAV